MRPASGLSRVLILAAAVLVVLATLRIRRPADRLPEAEAKRGTSAGYSKPEEPPPNTPEQTALLERIFAAWKKRQEQAKTFHFVWDSRMVQSQADAKVALPQWGWWEDRDGRFRQDSVAVEHHDDGTWRRIAAVRFIHDGSLNSRLTVPESIPGHEAAGPAWITLWRGDVRKRTQEEPLRSFLFTGRQELIPVLIAARPMKMASNWSPDKWQVASEDAVANNVHCVEIRERSRYSQFDTYWVDPNRDDVVVRWKGQNFSLAVNIDYQRDPKHGWLPSHWSWGPVEAEQPQPSLANAVGRGGNARTAPPLLFEETVRSYSIGEPLPAETFAQTYPAQTLVYDVTAGSETDWKREQSTPNVSQEARATLETIAAAWAKRRAKVQSFEVTGQRKRMVITEDWLRGPVVTNFTACADGDRFALESTGNGPIPRFPGSNMAYGPPAYVKTAFDGVETRGHWGWLRTGPWFDGSDSGDCVWLAFCPWDPRLTGLDPARFQLVAENVKVGEANCAMIRCDRSADWSIFLWLDRARDFIVCRKQEVTNGMDSSRVDFAYRQDANHGWIPTGWNESHVGSRWEPRLSLDDTVKEVTFNRPIPAARFTIQFPQGALVEDLDPEPLRDEKARNQVNAAIAQRWTQRLDAKAPAKPKYDPKFDARVELEKALKAARESKRRVLIEFGGQGSPDCVKLYEALTQNAAIATDRRKSLTLLLIDTDYHDAGQIVLDQYVPESRQGRLPLLTVMDPDETVLDISDTTALKTGDAFAVDRLKAHLERWSPHK